MLNTFNEIGELQFPNLSLENYCFVDPSKLLFYEIDVKIHVLQMWRKNANTHPRALTPPSEKCALLRCH